VVQSDAGEVLGKEAYARAHAWALQRARIAAGLRLPTPPTIFGLAMQHDGIDAVVTLSIGPGLAAAERSRLEAAVLSLEGIDLIALMEPVMGTGPTNAPVAITVRDDDYELRVVSPTEQALEKLEPAMQLMARPRLLQ
jgi:hypothetical protein